MAPLFWSLRARGKFHVCAHPGAAAEAPCHTFQMAQSKSGPLSLRGSLAQPPEGAEFSCEWRRWNASSSVPSVAQSLRYLKAC